MKQFFLGVAKRLGRTVLAAIGTLVLIALSAKFWDECGRVSDLGLHIGAFIVGCFAFTISVFAVGCTVATISIFFGWDEDDNKIRGW